MNKIILKYTKYTKYNQITHYMLHKRAQESLELFFAKEIYNIYN